MTGPTPAGADDLGLVEVARLGSLGEARLLAGRLEAAGIRTHIPGESTMDLLDGAAVIWSKGVPIEVGGPDAEEARRIVAAVEESRDEMRDESKEGPDSP